MVAALAGSGRRAVKVIGGRYGLGSKDTPPSSIFAVYEEAGRENPRRQFTVGITDDITNLSRRRSLPPTQRPSALLSASSGGLGGDGTVGANKNSIKIIGDHTDKKGAGLFPVRLQKDGRRDYFPPAFRGQAHKEPVLDKQGRFCSLPQPVVCHKGI